MESCTERDPIQVGKSVTDVDEGERKDPGISKEQEHVVKLSKDEDGEVTREESDEDGEEEDDDPEWLQAAKHRKAADELRGVWNRKIRRHTGLGNGGEGCPCCD